MNAAQLLEQRASAAYPDGDALIPVPLTGSIDPLDDVSFPLSFGAGRLTPLTAQLSSARRRGRIAAGPVLHPRLPG